MKHYWVSSVIDLTNIGTYNVIEKLKKSWKSTVYAYYHPDVKIEVEKGRKCLVFQCMNTRCKGGRVRRFLDTGDKSSTKNLLDHVRSCWGEAIQEQVSEAVNINEARDKIIRPYLRNGKVTMFFERKDISGTVSYSNIPHSDPQKRLAFGSGLLDGCMLTICNTGLKSCVGFARICAPSALYRIPHSYPS